MNAAHTEGGRVSAPEPRITVSIKRSADGSRATGELNSLSLGFGIFQVWLFMAVYNSAKMFDASALTPSFPYLPPALSDIVLISFLLVGGLCLIIIAATNQLFLKFYVSKRALFAATVICCVGTALLYGGCLEGAGTAFAILSGAVMGFGSSLLLVIWGTTFARFQFATIVLNTAISYVVGICISVICANWVPSPISGLITVLLPLASMPILLKLIPRPYYQRHEEPIFQPLAADSVNESSFLIRFGFPVVIVGITLGALRSICIGQVLPDGSLTVQLVFGLSCICSLVIYIMAIALTKRDLFWDTLFRVVMPVTMAGIASIALLTSSYNVLAAFCISMGYVCLEIMFWVFFAGIAQQFRISPIFVFGIGRGLLEFGSIFGSIMITAIVQSNMSEMGLSRSALVLAVTLAMGYAFLPRYREIMAMVKKAHQPHERTEAAVQMWDTTGQQHDQANLVGRPLMPEATALSSGPLGAHGGNAMHIAAATVPPAPPAASAPAAPSAPAPAAAEATPAAEAEETEDEKGSFRLRCEELSEQYLLSAREREVLVILAKGHNATFIQEQLCVSKSTAKTHINHIYKKMDIHTQQELLNMVEDRPRLSKRKASKVKAAAKAAAPTAPKAKGIRADIFKD